MHTQDLHCFQGVDTFPHQSGAKIKEAYSTDTSCDLKTLCKLAKKKKNQTAILLLSIILKVVNFSKTVLFFNP